MDNKYSTQTTQTTQTTEKIKQSQTKTKAFDYPFQLPNHFENYDQEQQQSMIQYLQSLSPIQLQAYHIAKNHLGTSFDLLRSNGYNEWINEMK